MDGFLDVAKKAVLESGEVVSKLREKKHTVLVKGDQSNIATEADSASEKIIYEAINSRFPKHNFWSEELGRVDNGSDYWWIVDPVDGTGPYFSGMPTYGISVGLVREGEPVLGILNFPTLNNMYWGTKGGGAFKNGKRIHVSSEEKLEKVMVGYDFSWMDMRVHELENYVQPLVDKVRYSPILGCTIAGLAYVSEGIYGGYIHGANNWDFAAGIVIVEEAGGKVTDLKGKKLNILNEKITLFASNGKIHSEVLSQLKS